VRFHISRPSSLVPRLVLRANGIRPDSQFGTFAKKIQDLYNAGKTTGSDEVKAAAKEVADFRPENPPSIGPYKIDKASLTAAQLTMVKNPGGLFADKVNFDKLVVYQGETTQITPLVLAGEGLDPVEYVGDLPFVMPEHDAFGQRVGDDQEPFQRKFPDQDRSADRDRFFGFFCNLYFRPLFFGRRDLAVGSSLQPLQKIRLLFGRQADEHHDAIAKKDGQSA